MNLLQELLGLYEGITAKHQVHNDGKLIAIMNMVEKKFGIDGNVNSSLGVCLLTQVGSTIASALDIPLKVISDYYMDLLGDGYGDKTGNNLGELVEKINSNPISISPGKKKKIKISVGKVKNASDIKSMLAEGQPVICAYMMQGSIGHCAGIIDKASEYDYSMDKLMNQLSKIPDPDRKKICQSILDGIIIKEMMPYAKKGRFDYWNVPPNNRYEEGNAYHSIICWGYDGAEKTFLFREARESYGRKGYIKVAEDVMTSQYIGMNRQGFHGMFYVDVESVEDVNE